MVESIDKKMEGYKIDLQKVVDEKNKAIDEQTKSINEDLAKKGASLAEIQETLKAVQVKQSQISAPIEEVKADFDSVISKAITEKYDEIKSLRKGSNIEIKTVGNMLLSANLTGSGVARYSLDPAVRGRRKVHFRDLAGVIPTDTGIWKFYQQNSTTGEGSFGVQTEGSGKSQLDYDVTEKTITVDVVAGFARISNQMRRDLPFMTSFLPNELREDYLRAEDNKFINELMAQTAAYSTSASVYAEKCIEWIAALMGRDYNPNAIVTTASNWATLLSTKPNDYSIPGGVTITANGEVAIAGVPVVVMNGMTGTKTFVADWSYVKIIQAAGLSINFYEQDSDNVQKNLTTVRAEAEVALADLRPDAVLYV